MGDFYTGIYFAYLHGTDCIKGKYFEAVIQVTEPAIAGWKLISCSPNIWRPADVCRRGQWEQTSIVENSFYQDGSAAKPDRDEYYKMFILRGTLFPPELSNECLVTSGYTASLQWGDPHSEIRWKPILSGPLLGDAQRELEEAQQAFQNAIRDLPVTVLSILDPTPFTSLFLSARDLAAGDYYGCALNLVSAIPLFGKLPKTARVAEAIAKAKNIEKLKDFIGWSRTATAKWIVGREGAEIRAACSVKPPVTTASAADIAATERLLGRSISRTTSTGVVLRSVGGGAQAQSGARATRDVAHALQAAARILGSASGPAHSLSILQRAKAVAESVLSKVLSPGSATMRCHSISELHQAFTQEGFRLVRAEPYGPQGGYQLFWRKGNVLARFKTMGESGGPRANVPHLSIAYNDGNGFAWQNDLGKFTYDGRVAAKVISENNPATGRIFNPTDFQGNPQKFALIPANWNLAEVDAWAARTHFNAPHGFNLNDLPQILRQVRP
jgi:hypothetical protein